MKDRDIEALLPWYVNGTLSPEECLQVEELLARSEDAREQVDLLHRIAEEAQSESVPDASELGWRRLQKEIKAEKVVEKPHWWKGGLAAAAMLVVALQVGILSKDPLTDTNTRLLGEGTPSVQQPHWLLQVELHRHAQWQQITELLQQINGRVVDGPSSLGIIRVAVLKEGDLADSPDTLLVWLREQSLIVHVALEPQK